MTKRSSVTQVELSSVLTSYKQDSEGMSNPVPKMANKHHDKMHSSYKVLRKTNEGRNGIMALMADPSPYVRCSAAAHSLTWDPNRARQVLLALRDSNGACSFEALMILRQFDKGELTFDF